MNAHPAPLQSSTPLSELLSAERAYDAAKAAWQRELWMLFGEPGLSLHHSDTLAKGREGSLLRELHSAYMAARIAYDEAGEAVHGVDEDDPEDMCRECDMPRGSCRQCQADDAADRDRGDFE